MSISQYNLKVKVKKIDIEKHYLTFASICKHIFKLPRKCRDNIINCVIFACKTLSKKGISLLRKINI